MRFEISRGTLNSNLNFDGFNANNFRLSRNGGASGRITTGGARELWIASDHGKHCSIPACENNDAPNQ